MTHPPAGRWRAMVRHDWASDDKALYVWVEDKFSNQRHWATGITFTAAPSNEGSYSDLVTPLIIDTRTMVQDRAGLLQELLDAFWDAGMKPTSWNEKANTLAHEKELASVRYHLDDMRTLVFKGKPR